MTTVKSGIIEKVQMNEETEFGDGGAGSTVEFGFIQKLNWMAETNTTANYSVDGDHKPNNLTDGVLSFSGGLEWKLTDGRELECIFGDLTDGGAGSFSLATSNELPSYGWYGVLDNSTVAQGKGFKFSRVTINGSRDGVIICSSDLVGQNVVTGGTITVQTPTEKPFVWLDANITINGGTAVDLEDFSLVIERNTEARRGIEATTENNKRLITSVFEKNLSITGSFTAVAKKEVFEAVLGGTTIDDYRSESNIVFNFSNETNTLVLTVSGLLTSVARDTGAEDELVTMSFDILGKSISGSGTYTT